MRFAVRLLALSVVACAHEPARGFQPPVPSTHEDPAPPAVSSSEPAALAKGVEAPENAAQVGLATWYGNAFAGKRTASGEIFDPRRMTAAHRKLPFGTWVEVRRIETGRTVRVRINDRGPWGDSRKIIDLSRTAAAELGIIAAGSARVEVRIVGGPE